MIAPTKSVTVEPGFGGAILISNEAGEQLYFKRLGSPFEMVNLLNKYTNSYKGWSIWSSLFVPVRTSNVFDVLCPMTTNASYKANSVASGCIKGLFCLCLDVSSLAVRLVTFLPRVVYNLSMNRQDLGPENVPIIDLLGKDVLQGEPKVRITIFGNEIKTIPMSIPLPFYKQFFQWITRSRGYEKFFLDSNGCDGWIPLKQSPWNSTDIRLEKARKAGILNNGQLIKVQQ